MTIAIIAHLISISCCEELGLDVAFPFSGPLKVLLIPSYVSRLILSTHPVFVLSFRLASLVPFTSHTVQGKDFALCFGIIL